MTARGFFCVLPGLIDQVEKFRKRREQIDLAKSWHEVCLEQKIQPTGRRKRMKGRWTEF